MKQKRIAMINLNNSLKKYSFYTIDKSRWCIEGTFSFFFFFFIYIHESCVIASVSIWCISNHALYLLVRGARNCASNKVLGVVPFNECAQAKLRFFFRSPTLCECNCNSEWLKQLVIQRYISNLYFYVFFLYLLFTKCLIFQIYIIFSSSRTLINNID